MPRKKDTNDESRTDLEQIFIDKQIANPGHWDGKLLNWDGQPYHEASMGLNPLRRGYNICAPITRELQANHLRHS